MKMFVTKKKLMKLMIEIAEEERTDQAHGEKDFYYRMGNYNALNALANELDMDLTSEIALKRIKEKEV